MLPSQPSDLFADHDLVALARYSGHGQARVIVEGNRRGTPVRWTSTVDFPDRERDNPFVARLWAAQRVGYLSAEKRKHGASQEIDDEIRTLGERYGIPTEFTSYLVTEPQRRRQPARHHRPGVGRTADGASRANSASSWRKRRRRSARSATWRCWIRSGPRRRRRPTRDGWRDAAVNTRRVDARTFTLRDGVWTDVRFRTGMETIIIKPYSKAYFDLLTQLPELRSTFALGDRVIVVGKSVAISLDDAKGASEITATMRANDRPRVVTAAGFHLRPETQRPETCTVTDLDRLFREYHQPLVRYLTRRLGDRDWAEEVAQETFLRAVRQGAIVSERAWLFAVATNLVRDEARRDARRRQRLELLREQARAEEVVEPEPLTIERAEEAAMARRAIEMLSERDREALLMKEEGLDYTEIAAALELSVASVGTTLARARRRLVEAYESLQESAAHKDGRGSHAAS